MMQSNPYSFDRPTMKFMVQSSEYQIGFHSHPMYFPIHLLTSLGNPISLPIPNLTLAFPLLDIFDSRVNKAGKVGAVYVKIDDGVLFEIKPHARIPRTYNRFCGLILDLLKKRCIRAEDTNEVLFRILNEPLSQHLPSNSRVSNGLEKLVDIQNYVSTCDDKNFVFVVSATDHKKINICADDMISVSHYPLVSMSCVGMICEALEHKWIVEPLLHN
ncbi:ribosomal RNA small subunit methyltransferase NEP1-like [Cucumis melo var. makuwa]|uniref:Ribosomal RNA small subunit methyltransferase NEP1-like n=1 Tax=Cucumis melo var. makuwa TaxID=1194695 RepID=A0A5D3CR92_CUCMM|nr:ribosomal RNA small subunit methyltransferase NEP1-like [Cucumis melo var. makuwa]